MELRKCAKCHNSFPKDILVNYKEKNYCPDCLKLRRQYDMFSDRICKLFGLKAPGPIINKQKDTLNKIGFTDNLIIETVEYCYYVKKIKKPTLEYVNAETVDEMKEYKKNLDYKENLFVSSISKIEYVPHYIKRYQKKEEKKEVNMEISDYLEDDVF